MLRVLLFRAFLGSALPVMYTHHVRGVEFTMKGFGFRRQDFRGLGFRMYKGT